MARRLDGGRRGAFAPAFGLAPALSADGDSVFFCRRLAENRLALSNQLSSRLAVSQSPKQMGSGFPFVT